MSVSTRSKLVGNYSRGASRSVSTTLLHGAQSQNNDAWQRLVDLFTPFVTQWLLRWGVPRDEMPDLRQNVFCLASQRIHQFRRDRQPSSFRGWLWRIARNVTIDYFRAARPKQWEDAYLAQLPEHREESANGVERAALLYRLIETIRGDFQATTFEAFWRCEIEGQETAEAARSLGMKLSTVREAKRRVMNRLREECRQLLGSAMEQL